MMVIAGPIQTQQLGVLLEQLAAGAPGIGGAYTPCMPRSLAAPAPGLPGGAVHLRRLPP